MAKAGCAWVGRWVDKPCHGKSTCCPGNRWSRYCCSGSWHTPHSFLLFPQNTNYTVSGWASTTACLLFGPPDTVKPDHTGPTRCPQSCRHTWQLWPDMPWHHGWVQSPQHSVTCHKALHPLEDVRYWATVLAHRRLPPPVAMSMPGKSSLISTKLRLTIFFCSFGGTGSSPSPMANPAPTAITADEGVRGMWLSLVPSPVIKYINQYKAP